MLTPESFALQLLLLPAMCCQQILLCHLRIPFPNLPHPIFFKHLMLVQINPKKMSISRVLETIIYETFLHGIVNVLVEEVNGPS